MSCLYSSDCDDCKAQQKLMKVGSPKDLDCYEEDNDEDDDYEDDDEEDE